MLNVELVYGVIRPCSTQMEKCLGRGVAKIRGDTGMARMNGESGLPLSSSIFCSSDIVCMHLAWLFLCETPVSHGLTDSL